jgi:hypothetical protein
MSKRVTPVLEPVGRSPKRIQQDFAIPLKPLAAKPPRFENLDYPLPADFVGCVKRTDERHAGAFHAPYY